MSVIADPHLLLLSMVGVGVAWASILSMPYAILAGALPPEKMGVYMGIFNFFIVIPQIAAAGVLGSLMKHVLGNDPMNAVLLGGASMIIAALATTLVRDVDAPTHR
jgi:maltose/moltooligosaccharide transporter